MRMWFKNYYIEFLKPKYRLSYKTWNMWFMVENKLNYSLDYCEALQPPLFLKDFNQNGAM